MKSLTSFIAALMAASTLTGHTLDTAIVIPHGNLAEYGYNQNKLCGVCTSGMGANEIEVWQSSLGPGDSTPQA